MVQAYSNIDILSRDKASICTEIEEEARKKDLDELLSINDQLTITDIDRLLDLLRLGDEEDCYDPTLIDKVVKKEDPEGTKDAHRLP